MLHRMLIYILKDCRDSKANIKYEEKEKRQVLHPLSLSLSTIDANNFFLYFSIRNCVNPLSMTNFYLNFEI